MLKSSGLKIPGRGPKHSSPVGRTSAGGTSRIAMTSRCTQCLQLGPSNAPLKPTTPTKISEEGDDVLGDYTVGEQVWVNGVKLGVIAYLGETQFAPGQWAGVILNDLVGKNDGSVGGVRYFECQPLQGIFTRPSKLTRQPVGEGSDTDSLSAQNQTQQAGNGGNGGNCGNGGNGVHPGQRVVVPLRECLLNSAVKTGYESGSNMSDSGSVKGSVKKGGDKDLRVGDRVLVGGSKMGVIRYMGETDFAKGEWCGVELDEPLGKNDGAVAGTRYFQCLHKFGLFAPPAKAKKSKRMAMGVSSLAHSPSSSSISSVSSVASSVGGRPSRTGLLTETSSRYARKISGTTALQEALKEKQQHIEQLLAERDMERAEMAKATSHICEVEKDLSHVSENESSLQQVKVLLASTQKDKMELANQLEEEKRKVEDLQFRVEEECITKGDLEQTTVEEQSHIMQLEEELSLRRAEMENLQPETLVLRAQLLSAGRERLKESSELKEKHEAALAASRQEIESLKAELERRSHEVGEMKQKVQQATRENVEMMDTWKVKFDSLTVDHQRSLGDLKASLSGDRPAPAGSEQDAQELRAALESLKTEHLLGVENLKAKHKIEAAILTKEREDFCTRLQEAKEQLAEVKRARGVEALVDSGGERSLEAAEKLQKAEQRLAEMEELRAEQDKSTERLRERLELAEEKTADYQALQKAQAESQEGIQRLEEKLRVTANQLQAIQADRYTSHDANVLESFFLSPETMEKLLKREKEVSALTSQVEALKSQTGALEAKVRSGEKKADALAGEKIRLEAELESMTKKSHDASGQLVNISQELLKKERSLNELRVLLLESHRYSRDMEKDLNREVHKAEWKVKEQKLQDDIKTLREKLSSLDKTTGRERSSPDHRRYSMLDPSVLDSEVSRLRQRLLSTEDALRNAMEHNQQVDQLVQAMRRIHGANSANGIHHQEKHLLANHEGLLKYYKI
uniref:CAP-Gly domain containing linker protein 2 n=1 Tax=Cyclopterus lumpus TaxID=8103 RepID=A0A8C3G9P7_CYCLU